MPDTYTLPPETKKTPAEAMAGNFTIIGLRGIAASWRSKIEEIDRLNERHGEGKGREHRDSARASYTAHLDKTNAALKIRTEAEVLTEHVNAEAISGSVELHTRTLAYMDAETEDGKEDRAIGRAASVFRLSVARVAATMLARRAHATACEEERARR